MWCTTRKPKGSLYTGSLTKLFEHSYRLFNKQYITLRIILSYTTFAFKATKEQNLKNSI